MDGLKNIKISNEIIWFVFGLVFCFAGSMEVFPVLMSIFIGIGGAFIMFLSLIYYAMD